MKRKDQTGKNNALNLGYFRGFCLLECNKSYLSMDINEKITIRASYCGNTAPSLMIKQLIEFNNA